MFFSNGKVIGVGWNSRHHPLKQVQVQGAKGYLHVPPLAATALKWGTPFLDNFGRDTW